MNEGNQRTGEPSCVNDVTFFQEDPYPLSPWTAGLGEVTTRETGEGGEEKKKKAQFESANMDGLKFWLKFPFNKRKEALNFFFSWRRGKRIN